MSGLKAYIVAARRTAVGRLGGLHRMRRLEDLSAPVVAQALADAALEAGRADALIVGNTTAGSNPARVIALIAGLPDRAVALTIDRNAASGLEAVIAGLTRIHHGDADVVVAGGAEAQSTAPWRLAKPRTLFHMPRFIGLAQADNGETGDLAAVEATEALASRLGITRSQQDEYAIASHIRATLARDGRRTQKEIVPLKQKAEEGRDELVGEPDIEELESIPAILGEGTLTAGNTSLPADAAAFVVAVSEGVYREMGRPPALVLSASASVGVAPSADSEAPVAALRTLSERAGKIDLSLQTIELGESSAVQALAFQSAFGLGDKAVNPDGGQVARGYPAGAASSVLLVRLFSRLVRDDSMAPGARGAVVIGASGGQGLAALFERT